MQGIILVPKIKFVGGRLFERLLSDSGVDAFNGAQGFILRMLLNEDGLPIREVSRQTGLAMATLTGMLDRMEASGLIRRARSDTDRRKVLIFLTDRSKAFEKDFDIARDKMYASFYKDFTQKEIRECEAYMSRILKNVEDALQQSEKNSKNE